MKFSKLFIIIVLTTSVRTVFSSQPLLTELNDVQAVLHLKNLQRDAAQSASLAPAKPKRGRPSKKKPYENVSTVPVNQSTGMYDVLVQWHQIIRHDPSKAPRNYKPLVQAIGNYSGQKTLEELSEHLMSIQTNTRKTNYFAAHIRDLHGKEDVQPVSFETLKHELALELGK